MNKGVILMYINATDLKNKLGEYLDICLTQDVIITRYGRKIAFLRGLRNGNIVGEVSGAYNFEDTSSSLGTMTCREFKRLSANTDERCEFIDGHVYFLASPSVQHQHASSKLFAVFVNWFEGKKCVPYYAPFDITLNLQKKDPDVVQPDINVICDLEEHMDETGYYMGVPSLVVEILSKSTRRKDMITKLNLYMSSGVKEYWIADPDNKQITVYLFDHNDIKAHRTFLSGMTCESFLFDGLNVKLDAVFMN